MFKLLEELTISDIIKKTPISVIAIGFVCISMIATGSFYFGSYLHQIKIAQLEEKIGNLQTEKIETQKNLINIIDENKKIEKNLKHSTWNYALPVVPEPSENLIVKELKNTPKVDYRGVHFFQNIKILDLRSRVHVPYKDRAEPISPVETTRIMLIKRLSSSQKSLRFEFHTSGAKVTPRCLTHPYSLKKTGETFTSIKGNKVFTKAWEMEIDISDVKVGKKFLVITEATYWNAFQKGNEWLSMWPDEKTDEASVTILFPEDEPVEENKVFLFSTPRNSMGLDVFEGDKYLNYSEKKDLLHWIIKGKDIKPNYDYRIQWETQ